MAIPLVLLVVGCTRIITRAEQLMTVDNCTASAICIEGDWGVLMGKSEKICGYVINIINSKKWRVTVTNSVDFMTKKKQHF